MIKDQLHTISDEDAIEVSKILLKTPSSDIYNYTFDKLTRIKYDHRDGTDAEESVDVYFNGEVKDAFMYKHGWKDERVMIKLIESDRYHGYPHFYGQTQDTTYYRPTWKHKFLSNHIEAIEFLQKKGLI